MESCVATDGLVKTEFKVESPTNIKLELMMDERNFIPEHSKSEEEETEKAPHSLKLELSMQVGREDNGTDMNHNEPAEKTVIEQSQSMVDAQEIKKEAHSIGFESNDFTEDNLQFKEEVTQWIKMEPDLEMEVLVKREPDFTFDNTMEKPQIASLQEPREEGVSRWVKMEPGVEMEIKVENEGMSPVEGELQIKNEIVIEDSSSDLESSLTSQNVLPTDTEPPVEQLGNLPDTSGYQKRRRDHKCRLCGRKFHTRHDLVEHIILHNEELSFDCDCLQVSQSAQSHIRHARYMCPHCQRTFTDSVYLDNHIASHTSDELHVYCKCGREFNTHYELTRHIKRHHFEKHNSCNKYSTRNMHLERYTRETQYVRSCNSGRRLMRCTDESPYRYHKCCSTYQEPDEHAQCARAQTTERTCNCCSCNSDLYELGKLVRNLKRLTDEKHCRCSSCIDSCRELHRNLRRQNSVGHHRHSGCHGNHAPIDRCRGHSSRTYQCSDCGNIYYKYEDLARHMRRHAPEKPYNCSQCNSSFREFGQLAKHLETHWIDATYRI